MLRTTVEKLSVCKASVDGIISEVAKCGGDEILK